MAERQLDLLEAEAEDSPFLVRRSPRARHMAITVGVHGIVEVVVPRGARPRQVEGFVHKHRDWIARTLREYESTHPPLDRSMPDRLSLKAVNQSVNVKYGMRATRMRGDVLELKPERRERSRCRAELRRWLGRTAKRTLVPRLEELSKQTGLQFQRVQVRGQRTRWGSHSSSGTLSINYCLLFLTPDLVDHLFIHELCHTREMNHSRRFWALVARYSPDYRQLEKRLDAAWRDVPACLAL